VLNACIPCEIVARAEFDDVVALSHPPRSGQDNVVFPASVREAPWPPAGLRHDLTDADVNIHAAVDLFDEAPVAWSMTGRWPLRTTRGAGASSAISHAVGTPSTPAIAASAANDGDAFSFPIEDR
jgi:hypothetical protein